MTSLFTEDQLNFLFPDEGSRIGGILRKLGITNERTLRNMTKDDLTNVITNAGLNPGQICNMIVAQAWTITFHVSYRLNAMTEILFCEWMDGDFDSHRDYTDVASPGKQTLPTSNNSPTGTNTSKTNANFRVDVKSIPKLPTVDVQSGFVAWDDAFSVIMELAGCGDMTKPKFTEPGPNDPTYSDFLLKDRWLNSAIITATMSTTAYVEIEPTEHGYKNLRALRDAYRGADFTKSDSGDAIDDLQKLSFGNKCNISASKFVSEYQDALRRLDRAGSPYPSAVIRHTFLKKITHSAFGPWIAVMKNKSDAELPMKDLYLKFRLEAKDVFGKDIAPSGTTSGDTNNQLHVRQLTGHSDEITDTERKEMKEAVAAGKRLPRKLWKALTQDERDLNIKNRKNRQESQKRGGTNANQSTADNRDGLPKQYGVNNVHSTMQDQAGNYYAVLQETASADNSTTANALIHNTKSNQQDDSTNAATNNNNHRAARLVKLAQTNNLRTKLSNLRVHLSAQVQNQLSIQDYKLQESSKGMCYVDGGTNISVMGKQFRMDSWTDRHVDMEGFANDLTKENIRIGNGLATVHLPHGEKVLVGLKEAPYLQHNKHSLLSSGQAREARTWVGDTLLRHGGDQTLAQNTEDGREIRIHLTTQEGLLGLELSYPTDDEWESLPRLWLTSGDVPWDPAVLGHHNDEILPLYGAFDHSTMRTNHASMQELQESIRCHKETHDFINTTTSIAHTMAFFMGITWPLKTFHSTGRNRVPDYQKYRGPLGWFPLETIKRTFDCTTQLAIDIGSRFPMRRHQKARNPQLNCRRLAETFSTDTFFSSIAAWGGATCGQLFCGNKSLYTAAYGMSAENQGPDALDKFCREHGAPNNLRNDNSKMQTGTAWNNILSKYGIKGETTEPYNKQQNPSENRIGMVKRTTNKIMDMTGAPVKAWLLCMLYVVCLLNHMATASLGWRSPIEACFGYTPDISHLLQFAFWEPVYFLDAYKDTGQTQFPLTDERFGYWAGPAPNVGDAFTYWIALPNGNTTLARSILRSARHTNDPNRRADAIANNADIHSSIIFEGFAPGDLSNIHLPSPSLGSDIADEVSDSENGEENGEKTGSSRKKFTEECELNLLSELLPAAATRKKGDGTNSMGNIDPTIIDSWIGESFVRHDEERNTGAKVTVIECSEETGRILLEYAHGAEEWVEPNLVQEALLSRDDDGQQMWSFKRVIAHRKDGNQIMVQVEWDNDDITWEPLSVMRKDDPVTVAKYAMDRSLLNERGWTWARKITKNPKKFLRMTQIMLGQNKQKKKSATKFKFGYEVPTTGRIDIARLLDKRSNTKKWDDAMNLEIDNLWNWETFEEFDPGNCENIDDYQFVNLMMCFDVKFDGRHKARLVANGARTEDIGDQIYSGVVSIRAVRLLLFLTQLNGLELCAADVSQAFLYSDCPELIYTKAGPEFGPEWEGKYLRIKKSLYGLKSSSAAYHTHLSTVLHKLGFIPSKADSDLWMKDCGSHYEYIATWVDDLLIASKDAKSIIRALQRTYELKGVGEPEYYLGGDIGTTTLKGETVIYTSAKTYINRLSEKIENLMDWKLKSYDSPENPDYNPELDVSMELSDEEHSKYRMMVGSLNWCVTLGRWDIHHATCTLARYSQIPRQGHMKAMERIFGYLKHHSKRKVVYDASVPDFSGFMKTEYDWFKCYPNATEEIDVAMPQPKGKPVVISGYFDASHASCLLTRRSVTGILLFINNTPIESISKRQGTVETATYGSELVAGRIAVDNLMALRNDLRWLGVPIKGSSVLFGDNLAMITNVMKPSSALKKRHNSIAYHRCREAIASGIVCMIHCPSELNTADALTKALGPIVYKRLIYNETKWPTPSDVANGELQHKTVNNVRIEKDAIVGVELDSLHAKELIAAVLHETFINNVRIHFYSK